MGGVNIAMLERLSFYRSFHMVEGVIIRSGVVDGLEEFEHVGGSGLVLGGFGAVGFGGIGGVEVIVVGGVLFVFVVGEPLEVLQLLMKILH